MESGRRNDGSTVVRNRDIPILANVLCVMQEVKALEERRAWQRDRMFQVTKHLTGMPRGGGTGHGMDDAIARLSEIDGEHERKCREYVRALRRAEHILNGIESQSMRTFVNMKYVMDIPDAEIRREINMTEWGFNRARKSVEEAPRMRDVVWREKYIVRDTNDGR